MLGGDHTVALPLLRALAAEQPIAVVHFDAHLDTWDTYFGAAYTHGTPFRRASEEGLLDTSACLHVGTRGPLYGARDLVDDKELGFAVVPSTEIDALGAPASPSGSGRASASDRSTSPSTSTCSTRPSPLAPARPRPAA